MVNPTALRHTARTLLSAAWFAAWRVGDGFANHDLRQDFGAEPKQIREAFDFYLQRFPVQIEVD